MGKTRFSTRELKFLELYFGGASGSMKDAVRAAGYRGSTPQALCNSGLRILRKFSKDPKALFGRARARQRKIAQLLAGMAENGKSERQQLKTLRILAALL